MSQARLLAGASSRVFERSSTARLSSHHQRLHADFGFPAFYHSASSTGLQCRSRASTSTQRVASTFLLPPSLYARTASTSTPQSSTSTKSTDPPPPVPTPSTSSKPKSKVELRPGPAKPSASSANAKPASQSSSQPQTSSAAKPPSIKPTSLPSTSPKEDALKETEKESVIELAKKDVADAARHGILTPPPPDANIVMRLFHQAKELFKFYWAGLKYVNANRKEVRKIKARIQSGGAPMSWREHRFILTNNSDMIKLVPFVLTLLVIEEIIPLIVIYVPGMLPSTCVLPSQRARIDAKRQERQREAYASAKSLELNDTNLVDARLKMFSDEEIKLLCSAVGISSFVHFGIHRRQLAKYLRSIAEEDKFLLKEGKGAKLNQNEITEALWDRGFLADSYTPVQQRDRLRWWLDNVKADTTSTDISAVDVRAPLLLRILRDSKL